MLSLIFRVLLTLLLFDVLGLPASAKSWQGITPLQSTRKDVVRLFKQCDDKTRPCEFSVGNESVSTLFSDNLSAKFHPCINELPEGTVMLIKVTPQTKIPLASLDLRRGFRKFNPSVPPQPGYAAYLDRKQGVISTSFQGVVLQMTYLASQSDSRACPSYYEDPEAMVQIGTFNHSAMMELRCPSRVKAGEVIVLNAFLDLDDSSEPVYLWNIPAEVPFSGRGTRKVTRLSLEHSGRGAFLWSWDQEGHNRLFTACGQNNYRRCKCRKDICCLHNSDR